MTNDLIHLEFACQVRKSRNLGLLPENGNEPDVPTGKYSQYTGTSTRDIQEEVDKPFSELCDKQAERIHFRAG
jgi:hypothetical protein